MCRTYTHVLPTLPRLVNRWFDPVKKATLVLPMISGQLEWHPSWVQEEWKSVKRLCVGRFTSRLSGQQCAKPHEELFVIGLYLSKAPWSWEPSRPPSIWSNSVYPLTANQLMGFAVQRLFQVQKCPESDWEISSQRKIYIKKPGQNKVQIYNIHFKSKLVAEKLGSVCNAARKPRWHGSP